MEYNVTMDCSEAKAMTKSLDFPECQIKSILLERGVKLEDPNHPWTFNHNPS